MEKQPYAGKNDRAQYDKLQLLRLNNIAFSQGLITQETKETLERQIWAS